VDDSILVERCRHGDEGAFNQLVERHKREAYRIARRLTRSHEDARDLAQDAFIRCYHSMEDFRGECSFRTWLYRIVVNLSLNQLKSPRVSRRTELPEGTLERLPADGPGADPAADLELARRSEQLRAAIDRLPPKQKQTLTLKVYGELKYEEISEVMRCPVGTAKANFYHAVKRLRELMDDEEQGS
jgi:RNA polymerase sigma-70 factor (ECF subfamily)